MSNSNQNQGIDELLLFLGIGMVIIAIFFLFPRYQWVFFEYWRISKVVQFSVFSWVDISFFQNISHVKHQLLNEPFFTDIKGNFENISSERRSELNQMYWTYINEVDSRFTKYFSWLAGVFIAYLGFRTIMSTNSVTKVYNFETLLSKYSPTKDYYTDILNKKQRPDLMSYDESVKKGILPMTPYEFATSSPPPGLEDNRPIFEPESGVFDNKLAQKAFDIQLGKKWTNVEKMNKGERYVYDMLKNIVEKKTNEKAEDIMDRHAYIYTGLKTLYIEAKKTGIVAPAWFRKKIKYEYPFLWRTISDTGRLPLVMGGGISAHHSLELFLGEPIDKPATEAAVYALAESIGYDADSLLPIEEFDKK